MTRNELEAIEGVIALEYARIQVDIYQKYVDAKAAAFPLPDAKRAEVVKRIDSCYRQLNRKAESYRKSGKELIERIRQQVEAKEKVDIKMPYAWKCPTCGYLMTDIQKENIRYDVGCPRCKTPISNFENLPSIEAKEKVDDNSRIKSDYEW